MVNIAKLLRDCPKWIDLYSPLFGKVKFLAVDSADSTIIVETGHGTHEWFSACGIYKVMKSHLLYPGSECLLFPSKDCRTWEGWKVPVKPNFKVGDWICPINGKKSKQVRVIKVGSLSYLTEDRFGLSWPIGFSAQDEWCLWTIVDANDGDVLATDNGWTCIFKAFDGCVFSSYCFMDSQKWFCELGSEAHTLDSRVNGNIHPATKEQRDLFFKRMQEVGYQWDADKKELKKIKPHYDIANFKPFDKVLCRGHNRQAWRPSLYGCYDTSGKYPMFVCATANYLQCIPYDGNEHLLGTTNMCDEQYINW